MGILILLGIGFIVRLKNKSKVGSTKVEDKCPTCNGVLYDKDKNYCTNCGSLSSHSEGISLDSQNITNITNINISDSVISKSKVGNKETSILVLGDYDYSNTIANTCSLAIFQYCQSVP